MMPFVIYNLNKCLKKKLMEQWTNAPMDQWTNGQMDQRYPQDNPKISQRYPKDIPMDQWTNGHLTSIALILFKRLRVTLVTL